MFSFMFANLHCSQWSFSPDPLYKGENWSIEISPTVCELECQRPCFVPLCVEGGAWVNATCVFGQFWHQTELVGNACLGTWVRRRWGCLSLLWARRQLHHWLASKNVNPFQCAVLPGEQCRFIRSFCFRTCLGPGSTTYCVALDRSAFCASVASSIKWKYEWALSPKVVERMKWNNNVKYLNLCRTHKQSKNKCWPFFLVCRWVAIFLRAFSNWACSALSYLLFLLYTGLFQRMRQY